MLIITLLAGWLTAPQLQAQTSYNLTVRAGGLRQSFGGFGVSEPNGDFMTKIPPPYRDQMLDMVFTNLPTKIVRLWLNSYLQTNGVEDMTVDTMTNYFYFKFVSSGAIAALAQRGVTNLLLGPTEQQAYYTGLPPLEGMAGYADRLAETILRIRNAWGIQINATGICNEPNWSNQNVVDCVNYLRAGLDSRGLTSVKIIAPEWPNNDSYLNARLDAMYSDATAWSRLSGIASHSYSMAAGNDQEDRKRTKEFWMTEASEDGKELLEDDNRASTISARFLNDMNHKVDKWVFFIGYWTSSNVQTDNDTAVKLMVFDDVTKNIYVFLKYYYFQQILSTFDLGAVFRRCDSASEYDMAYSNGQKPAINAAAAINPDGSWAIGIVNDTGASWYNGIAMSTNTFYPASSYSVNLTIQELTNTPSMTFTMYSSRADQHFANIGTVTLVNGQATVPIAAKQLICLRSAARAITVPPVPTGLTGFAGNVGNSLDWDDTAWATSWNVKRATNGGSYATIASTTTTHYTDTNLVSGLNYYYIVSATNASGESPNSTETTAAWSNADIGSVGLAGSTAHADPTFTVSGAGSDIGWTNDSCQFAYRTMAGDGAIIARLAYGIGGKVGLMMRESINGTAASVTVERDATYARSRLAYRTRTGTAMNWIDGLVGASCPRWYKLTRAANTFTGYVSTDGTNWTTVGSASVTMASTITVGMAVCSLNTNTLNIARFDYVTAPAAPVLPSRWQINAVLQQGVVVLSWQSVVGHTYNVMSADSLAAPSWSSLSGSIIATDSMTFFTNNVPSSSLRFYRVQEQ